MPTFHLGLIGYPLGHSLSPKIHAAALESCGFQGNYSLFPAAPDNTEGLKFLLGRVRSGELHGLNVTIPHKQNVIPLLDELTPTAQAIGAVNTIFMRDGELTGDNTDAPGFLKDLQNFLGGMNSIFDRRFSKTDSRVSNIEYLKFALVLGAGGSARAVVYALANDGWNVTVAARRIEQAEELVSQYTHSNFRSQLRITNYELSALPETTLIVNSTPVGMIPNVHHSPWPAGVPFLQNSAIYDLVYNPRETRFVRDARAADLPAVTGLGMLIEQAALAFEIWTGCYPAREALIAAVN